MKKIYKFRVILSIKSYNEGELYEREINRILKDYGEESTIVTAGLLSSNTMSVNVMVLTTESTLGDIKSDIANTTGFEIKGGLLNMTEQTPITEQELMTRGIELPEDFTLNVEDLDANRDEIRGLAGIYRFYSMSEGDLFIGATDDLLENVTK